MNTPNVPAAKAESEFCPYSSGTRRTTIWALSGILLLGLFLRSLGWQTVFVGGEDVVFESADPYYHLRLALYALEDFPRVLTWDPYLNFPDGSPTVWGPFYDLLVAGSAWLLGGSRWTLELVAAWWPPILGTLAIVGVYDVARNLGGRRLGLRAAGLHALLPAAVITSRVGYADHHAAVACLCAFLLALQVRSLGDEDSARPASALRVALLAGTRAALVLTWPGSLMVLAVADVSLVLTGAALGRRSCLLEAAASLLITALVVAPFVALVDVRLAGDFSIFEPSWLHVAACTALSFWALGCRSLSPQRSVVGRTARGLVLGAGIVALLLVLPGAWAGIEVARDFMARADVWGATNAEQIPLFQNNTAGNNFARVTLGHLAWLLPIAPIALLARARPGRCAPLLVVTWFVCFGTLAVLQARFVNEFAPAAAVGFALTIGWPADALARRFRWRSRSAMLVSLAAGIVLLLPALRAEHAPRLAALYAPGSGSLQEDRALRTPAGSFLRFARTIHSLTPETAGFMDPERRPEYGVLITPGLGHALTYLARRAAPAGNFGPFVFGGARNLLDANRALDGPLDDETWNILERLETRYIVTNWMPGYRRNSLTLRLHAQDGRGVKGEPPVDRIRLIAEGPAGGLPLAAYFTATPRNAIPYKLFQLVEGALLEIEGETGTPVLATVRVKPPGRRPFLYRVRDQIDASGRARLRIPYSTDARLPVRARGPVRVAIGKEVVEVEISERDVLEGRRIQVRWSGAD